MLDKDAIQELSRSEAIRAANACMTGGFASVALPKDFHLVDLESYLNNRIRMRGKMSTTLIDDFASYVNANAEAGATVFVDPEALRAAAVLNLGTPSSPGHADNIAVFAVRQTAAYTALLNTANGRGLDQKMVAEFFEDWADHMNFRSSEGEEIGTSRAIAAIRKLSIEAMRKVESEEKQLGASKSAFESVQASGADTIPTFITFNCVPYSGFIARTFGIRLSILTGGNAPAIVLRIIKMDEHMDAMADELVAMIADAIGNEAIPVLAGTYQVK